MLSTLYRLYQRFRHRNARHALQNAAENSDDIEEYFRHLEDDDRVELTDEQQ